MMQYVPLHAFLCGPFASPRLCVKVFAFFCTELTLYRLLHFGRYPPRPAARILDSYRSSNNFLTDENRPTVSL